MEEVSEAELLAVIRAGGVLDCGDGGRRAVDAALLRRCCHELQGQVDPRGIRLRNAAISGSLDLASMVVPFGLRFDCCEFESPVIVEGAQLFELALRDVIGCRACLGMAYGPPATSTYLARK